MSIECTCSIDAHSDDDPADLWYEKIRSARKAHRCCECGDAIQPGEQYEYAWGLSEGSWWSAKTCLICRRIRRDHCCTWVYGHLREALWDGLGVDYISGEVDDNG